jgi:hypothetical protein
MRRVALVYGIVMLALFLDGTSVKACGDKLLVLGRGVRFQSDIPVQPASILIYKLNNPGLLSVLREAGHKIQAVEKREDLEAALKAGKYDIVLTVLADAGSLEGVVASAPSKPFLVPLVYKGAKAEVAMAEKQYGCALKAPNRVGHYLATVDKAMDLRSKRDGLKPTLMASK